jgi:hypothetical protein
MIVYSLFKFICHEKFPDISKDKTCQYTLKLNTQEKVLHVLKMLKPHMFIKKHFPPYTKVTAKDLVAETNSCSICLDLYATTTYKRTLPCGHAFHKTCVDKWLKQAFHCPYCRHEYAIPLEKVFEINLLEPDAELDAEHNNILTELNHLVSLQNQYFNNNNIHVVNITEVEEQEQEDE